MRVSTSLLRPLQGVDGRAKPTAVRFSFLLQLHEEDTGTTFGSPWPDLFRPPTSSNVALSTAGKAWMAGTSPAKGIVGCIERATNNRFRSTGQPWAKPGQDEIRVAISLSSSPQDFPRTALRKGRGRRARGQAGAPRSPRR